ncbi:MAG: hypothetical protein HDR51_02340 [Treponema sp.]|nr:hypothetical protein [Treponema sp.]
MEKKLTLNKIALIIALAVLCLIFFAFLILYFATKKPVAAFYGIPENTQQAIESVLQTTYTRKNKSSLPYTIKILDSTVSLKDALKHSKKPDIIFINSGLNCDYIASIAKKKKRGFSLSILDGMTSSIRNITPVSNNSVNAVPLLIDNYEIDIDINTFRNSDVEAINFWSDIESFASKIKPTTVAPILFSANDDETIINVFGALVESFSGVNAWSSMVEKIQQTLAVKNPTYSTYSDLVSKMIEPNGELHDVVNFLIECKRKGILPKNLELTTFDDISAYMSANLTAIVFMTLSQHRTIEYETISKYSTIYYPSTTYNVQRHFTAPVLFAVPNSKNKISRTSIEMLASSLQGTLSTRTGLAPTQANCSTPDKQADDVRYWIAASEDPLPTLSEAAFTTKAERNAFAEVLRNLIKI